MSGMRAMLLLGLLLLSPSLRAESLSAAQQAYRAGAPHLALAIVVREQGSPQDVDWYDWESLRLSLLSATHQPEEILSRTKSYSASAPQEFQQKALGHLAWAQLELKHNAVARGVLAHLLWQFDLTPADQQSARRLLIHSYLNDHRADEAYRAMLRYEQDYAPVGAAVAEEFCGGLMQEQKASEALTWLPQLTPGSATALRLQLKAGLLSPELALKAARTVLAKPGATADYALVIVDAAAALHDPVLGLNALEQWLDLTPNSAGRERDLWQAYLDYAQSIGNRAQLLQGDDAAWLSQAQLLEAQDPLAARALYAYSAAQARGPAANEAREIALANLFKQLVVNHLTGLGARLFTAAPWGEPSLQAGFLRRLVARASAGETPAIQHKIFVAAGRLLAQDSDTLGAAAYFALAATPLANGVVDSETQGAAQSVASNLAQAGYSDEAAQWLRFITAQATAAAQAAHASPPSKSKRKSKR